MMTSRFARSLRPLCLLACIAPALGSTVHTVYVGAFGSFFDPPTLSAAKNDIVSFVFSAGIHSVVQSNINAPCSPLPGGFSSGPITATNLTLPRLSWDLLITDDTSPIYYFCAGTKPESHCNAGMVGAINSPAIAVYNSWASAAKLATGTPAFTATFVGSGIGAIASGTPSTTSGAPTSSPPPPTPTPPPPASTTSTSMTISMTTSSTTPTPTIVAARARLSGGTLAGVLVAGLVALFIILVLSFLLYKTRRRTPTPLSRHLLDETSSVSTTQVSTRRSPEGQSISYSPNFPENPLHPPIVTPTPSFNRALAPLRLPGAMSPVRPVHDAATRTESHLSDHPYEGQPAQSHGCSERQPHHYSPAPQIGGADNTRSAPVEQAQNIDQTQVQILAREVAREVVDIMSAAENLRASSPRNRSSLYAGRDRQLDGVHDSSPSLPSYHLSPS